MRPREIKAEIIRRGIAMSDIANEAKSSVQEVSMCIHGTGLYKRIRNVIAKKIEQPVEKVFNKHHPQPKRLGSKKAA